MAGPVVCRVRVRPTSGKVGRPKGAKDKAKRKRKKAKTLELQAATFEHGRGRGAAKVKRSRRGTLTAAVATPSSAEHGQGHYTPTGKRPGRPRTRPCGVFVKEYD